MKRLCLILSVAAAAGCGKTPESALSVRVRAATTLKADCIELAISSGGAQRKSLMLKRAAMKEEWVIGVMRGDDLPETVTFQARAYLGTCSDASTLKLNSRSADVQATFPKEGVENVQPLQLDPPDATLDGDRDGFVDAAKGGADCDDTNATTFPGSVQQCTTEADTDCDGQGACADSDCSGSAQCVDPPDRLALVDVPLQLARTECRGPIYVELRNSAGPRAAGVTTAVQLSAMPAGFSFFSESSCSTAVTSANVPFQQSRTAGLWVRGDVAGMVRLRAASGALTPATSDTVVVPQPVTALVFTTPPRTIVAGSCTANEMTLELRDSQGRLTTVTSPLTVSLTATPNDATGNFSAMADCTTPVSAVSIPAGQGSVTFRVFSRRAAMMTVEARADVGVPVTATQQVTVTADVPAKLAFLNQPLAFKTTDACPTGRLIVEVQDQYGNRAPTVVPLALRFTGSTGVTFYDATADATAGNCATPVTSLALAQGGAEVRLAVKSATPGAGSVTVSEQSSAVTQATQSLSVSTGDPNRVIFEGSPGITDSNICTPIPVTLVAYDAANVRAAFPTNTTIALSTNPAVPGLAFYTAAGCGSGLVVGNNATFPAGVSQLQLYFRGPTAASNFIIRATPPAPISGSDLAGNTIRPGPPASLRFNPTAQTTTAGTCVGPVTVGLFDAAGNAASFTAATDLSFSAPSGVFTWGTSSSSCGATTPISIAAGQSAVPVYFSSSVARSYTVSGTAGTVSTSIPLTLTVTPGASTGLSIFEPSGGNISLVAGTCVQATVERKDALMNDVPVGGTGATLTFPTVPPGVTFYASASGCQTAMGAVTQFSLTSTESRKTFFVRGQTVATAAPLVARLLGQDANFSVTVTPASASVISFNGLPSSQASGACSGALSLTRKDAFGNNATADGVLQANVAGAGLTFYTSPDCTTGAGPAPTLDFAANQATSTTFSVNGLTVGTYPVTATAAGMMDTQNFTVTAGAASKVVITTAGATVDAGSCVAVNADIFDANNNPVSGTRTVNLSSAPEAVNFYTTSTCSGSPVTSVNTSGSRATFYFRPTQPTAMGMPLVITASSGTLTAGTQSWTVVPGAPNKLAWKTPPPATLARFTCSNEIIVELQDVVGNATGNLTSSRTIVLASSATGAGLTFFSDSGCTTPVTSLTLAVGATQASVWVAVTGSTQTNLTASSSMPTPVTATSPVQLTPSGTVTDKLVVTVPGTELEAGGCMQVTVERQTAAGTPLTMGTTTFSLASNNAGVTLHTTADCTGNGVATQMGLTIGNGASTNATMYARGRSVSAVTSVSLTATDSNSGTVAGSVSVNAYPLVRRGSCDFADTNLTKRCVLSPAIPNNDITRSFLVFSSSGDMANNPGGGNVVTPADSNVECHLDATVSDVAVACSRGDNHQPISVSYQVVSWGRDYASGGVTVRHYTNALATNTTTTDIVLTPAVANTASTFLLFSSSSASGSINNEDDFPTVRLVDASTVRLARADTAGAQLVYSVQVVEFSGATVARNTLSNQTGAGPFQVNGLPDTSGRAFLLFTARADVATNNDQYICKRRLRGFQGSGTALRFRRGAGGGGAGTNCTNSDIIELEWERVALPVCSAGTGCNTAQEATVTLTGATTGTQNITGVTRHKSIVFFAGQGAGGQASGETNYNNSNAETGDNTGAVHGVATFDSDTVVRATRALNNDTAVFSPQVVQFDP